MLPRGRKIRKKVRLVGKRGRRPIGRLLQEVGGACRPVPLPVREHPPPLLSPVVLDAVDERYSRRRRTGAACELWWAASPTVPC